MPVLGSLLKNLFGKRYTIGELMNVDPSRQGKSSACSVSFVDSWLSVKEEGVISKFKNMFNRNTIKVCYVTFKLLVTSDTGHTHTVFIQLDPDFSMNNLYGNRVRIYCDCSDFKFRSAYILSKRDSLFANDRTKLALGQAYTTAPTGKKGLTYLCKHCIAALNWLAGNYSSIMQNI